MAQFDKMTVMAKIADTRMVPVFYHKDAEVAKHVIKACYDGGVRVFEFTNRGDFAHEVFSECIRFARIECPELALGAGSIVDPSVAALYIQSGACFVVGPLFNAEVAMLCNRHQIPYCPGCGTVTEIGHAHELGCELVKVFPGDVLGPEFVKSIMAPMPWTRMMITGGVAPEFDNLAAWFAAGAFCVGMGSKLFPTEKIAKADWVYIKDICSRTLSIINELCKK
ncbi:MAG: bifunctional 4-hydroxy-2-oxoglutarate aldolase/2-dehydro-3-deoxy-phosphogluconate aldolase [Prevotella sp.]